MSLFEHKSIQSPINGYDSVPDEINCTFRFGKNDMQCELREEMESEKERELGIINLTTSEAVEAIKEIESQLKLLCSLQAHNFDGSLTSVFNNAVPPTESSVFNDRELSFELPVNDSLSSQEFLDDDILSSPFSDFVLDVSNWPDDFPIDPNTPNFIEELLKSDPIKDKSAESVLVKHKQNARMCTTLPLSRPIASAIDETTRSSRGSTSKDLDRDQMMTGENVKRSGGPVRQFVRFGNQKVRINTDEYYDRRVKNNEAVKKSREKARQKQKETDLKMTKLTVENRQLTHRVNQLMKELEALKSFCANHNQELPTD